MTKSLCRFIGLFGSLAAIVLSVEADFPTRKLDCSGVISNFPLAQFELYCDAIVNPSEVEFSLMNRMDIIEMCTCALLRRTIVFQAILTHEIEFIYLSTRKLLDTAPYNHQEQVKLDNLMLVNNPDGIMDFWDRLGNLLRTIDASGMDGLKLSNKFLEFYTDNYYKPEEFKMAYKGQGQTANFRRELSSRSGSAEKEHQAD